MLHSINGLSFKNLELLNQRYKAEIEGFVEANGIKEAFGEKFKAMQEENERLQEENDGIRYILAKFFETTTSSVRDSGHWSTNSSNDDLSIPNSEIEECLSSRRLLRHYRLALCVANQTIQSRDELISQFEEMRATHLVNF